MTLGLPAIQGQPVRGILDMMPFAVFQVDTRWPHDTFLKLAASGITDLAAHFAAHPELVEEACDRTLVCDVNRKALELFGTDDREAMIAPVRYIFSQSIASAARVMVSHASGERLYSEIFPVRTLDGRLRDMRFSASHSEPLGRDQLVFVTMEDVTEQRQAELQLRKLREDFDQVARLSTLGEMASSIAHELRQPLSSMSIGAATGLRWLTREPPDPAAAIRQFRRVEEDAQLASAIIERILDMARARGIERAVLDLNAVIDEALAFLRHDLDIRQIATQMRRRFRPAPVLGDRILLQQVIVNLVLNGAQAIAEQRGTRREIRLALDRNGDSVELTIEDSGPGIPPDAIGRIFDSFYTTRPEGLGIGLAVCQSIVAAHSGTISAANAEGGGARFLISLPLAQAA